MNEKLVAALVKAGLPKKAARRYVGVRERAAQRQADFVDALRRYREALRHHRIDDDTLLALEREAEAQAGE